MKKKFLEDLEYFLLQTMEKRGVFIDPEYPNENNHLYFYLNHTPEELRTFIISFLDKYKVNDKYDFLYLLNSIIKYMSGLNDIHTSIRSHDNNWFPIRFKIIDDTIYIDDINDKKYIKSKLESINDIPISKIFEELDFCSSYGINPYKYFLFENYLYNRNILLSLPSISSDSLYIEYKTDKGIIKFDVNKQEELKVIGKFDNYIIKDDILVFKYPLCNKIYKPDINRINNIIKQNNIRNFVLDLRNNHGGDSRIITPLFKYLEESNLKLTTIVNGAVVSSGHHATIAMKKMGSKIIGDDIGTPMNYFGFISPGGVLPNTKYIITFPKMFWTFNPQTYEILAIHTVQELLSMSKEELTPKYLEIDEHITMSKEEYEKSNDEDIILNKCLEYVKKSNYNHLR